MMADGKEVVLEQGQNLNILLNERVRVATSSQGIVYEEHGKGMVTEEYNKLTTPVGGEYSLVLSDGTKVFLNADSELKYPVEFSDGKRIVDLKGEAYFEVHKDSLRSFIVRMNGAEVTVLGTSFNVNTYGDDGQIYTTLVNGSVRVSSMKNKQEEIETGDAERDECAVGTIDREKGGCGAIRGLEGGTVRVPGDDTGFDHAPVAALV